MSSRVIGAHMVEMLDRASISTNQFVNAIVEISPLTVNEQKFR